jgi:hypothetical protein
VRRRVPSSSGASVSVGGGRHPKVLERRVA